MEKLKGDAWNYYLQVLDVPENWRAIRMKDGKIVGIDEERINVVSFRGSSDVKRNTEVLAAYDEWIHLGSGMEDNSRSYFFLFPKFSEIDFQRYEEIEVWDNPNDFGIFMKIGTLNFEVEFTEPMEYFEERDDYELLERGGVNICSAAMISINRDGASDKVEEGVVGRNPDLAELRLRTDLKLASRQLKSMGFTHLLNCPTDLRRSRAYNRFGFTNSDPDNPLAIQFMELGH